MEYKMNYDTINRDTIKISETNKILQKYRNLAITYDLIRKILFEMNEGLMNNANDILIYE